MITPHPTPVLVAALLTVAACGDRTVMRDKAGTSPAAVAVPAPSGITLAGSSGAGLALEGVVLVRETTDIVELRADLVNRGAGAAEVGSLQRALVGPAGPGAAALVTEDGGKRFYPLIRVDAGTPGETIARPRLEPGGRSALVIRFGPVAADVARLTPVVPGFSASPPLQIAEDE